ncbi:MAG: sigma-70 family RNA polymerase sigma factor [Verrucomicrobiales bacterium]|nr:sigma-70 family RNA polymerase sigma factor [Verrucomicrobiales bacterium]
MDAAPPDIWPCLEGVLAGDDAAACDLVCLLHPLVMKIVRANRPNRMSEEDLGQEVFAKVFDRLPSYERRDGVPFEHWVARLAVRTCLDAIRAENRRPEVRLADLADGEQAWLDYLTQRSETSPMGAENDAVEIMERLLEGLSPEDRLVIRLMDLQEHSAAEVSRLTGWSAVGVRVRAFRARTRLRRLAQEARQKGHL